MTAAANTQDAIVFQHLGMDFGNGARKTAALKDLCGSIFSGCITGLMGPDAAGKTTLMRLLAGLLTPTAGNITIFGIPVAEVPQKIPNDIGYMPQRFGLYEDLSVLANLELYASLRGVTGRDKDDLFKKLLGFTALAPFTKRLAGQLSGGMKQKLGIACALLGNPRLLLLDEPGVGVDPRSRRELWEMVQQLNAGGMTVIWSTSYFDEGERCPRLIMLDKGVMLFNGVPADLNKRAAGRVFLLEAGVTGREHRSLLMEWTGKPGVLDAMIQGKYIRLMLAKDAGSVRQEILAKGGTPAAPHLEDAYMDIMGGIDKRPSPYAGIQISGSGDRDARIAADKLTRKFGDFTAAHNITFKVAAGEIVGLLGPNGAGKSTTFRMLCGLLRPTSGACSVDGVDMLKSSSQARARLGYMAQKFSLYPEIPVLQNIIIQARLYGLDKKRYKKMVPLLSNVLDLDDYLESVTSTLPLGLKQRLSLLCATLHVPPVLFLDEPTSGVDARTRRDFWKHISALTVAGAAVLVTTHFMEEAEYCDRIALIYKGNMINFGTPDELKAKVSGVANPTLEDAFVTCIRDYDREHPETGQ